MEAYVSRTLAIASFIALPCLGHAESCYDAAATAYGLEPELLHAVMRVESGGDPGVVHRNRDGSLDIGVMQVNSRHLPALRRHGIDRERLRNPCINAHVGAWLLAGSISRNGGLSWLSLGAYNAGDPSKRRRYAERVLEQLRAMRSATAGIGGWIWGSVTHPVRTAENLVDAIERSFVGVVRWRRRSPPPALVV